MPAEDSKLMKKISASESLRWDLKRNGSSNVRNDVLLQFDFKNKDLD